MGAWNYGVFDDDSAYDVMDELEDCDDVAGYLEKAFDDATQVEYLDFDEGIAASVCGAVLDSILFGAAYRFDGFNSDDSETEGDKQYLNWIASVKNTKCECLKSKAVQALNVLVSDKSELYELWFENEELFPKWKGVYKEMIARFQK